MKIMIRAGIVLAILFLVLYVGVWKWGMSRVYVDPDETLMVTSKFGAANPDPENMRVIAQDSGYKGIWKEVMGEGRHFYNPIEYDTRVVSMIEIGPGEVGIVESKSGTPLPEGEFLAEDGQKGILRKPLTPGKWRVNPLAYEVQVKPAILIEPGYVGCVTARDGIIPPTGQLAKAGQRGVREDVLQPGLYYLNPHEWKVEPVEIGYRQITIKSLTFPSKDGFEIKLDISVVWGLLPKEVPSIISTYGNVDEVVDKVIQPQVMSICRIEGSKYGAKEFIEGDTREVFQNTFTQRLEEECEKRNIAILIGLVRDITVPREVRDPIQQSKIAAEETNMKTKQAETQIELNTLEELRSDVTKGVREVGAETEKLVAEVEANGERQIATIRAEQNVSVAEIMRKVAEIEAERERMLGKAEADVTEMVRKAEADFFKQNVQAMGDSQAYADYIFAKNLADDLQITIRYAGEGTFWTDMKSVGMEAAAAAKILDGNRGGQ